MTTFRAVAALCVLSVACATDRSRSPACGLALVVGPSMILQQLRVPQMVLTGAPRGLPASLPARVVGQAPARVDVSYDGDRLAMTYQGAGFPPNPTERYGYGLLVVDDTSQRVTGLLIYDAAEMPRDFPLLGAVTGDGKTLPVYGVRVDWASMSNPRCPLLGDSTPAR